MLLSPHLPIRCLPFVKYPVSTVGPWPDNYAQTGSNVSNERSKGGGQAPIHLPRSGQTPRLLRLHFFFPISRLVYRTFCGLPPLQTHWSIYLYIKVVITLVVLFCFVLSPFPPFSSSTLHTLFTVQNQLTHLPLCPMLWNQKTRLWLLRTSQTSLKSTGSKMPRMP